MLWRYRSSIKCVPGPSAVKRRKVAALRLLRPSGKLLTLVTQVPEVGTELGLQGWVLLNLYPLEKSYVPGLRSFWMCQAMIAWLCFRDRRESVIAALDNEIFFCMGLICASVLTPLPLCPILMWPVPPCPCAMMNRVPLFSCSP